LMKKQRAIVHVDGDGFFASCEIALNPRLKGKPVVTGQERGIATAMSPEAKKLGIHRGMPVFQIRKLYPEVVIVNSNYHTYGMFAQRMYDIVRRFTDKVEEYSIDECFADITDLEREGVSYADGMTFSLGLGPTKVIAKVASKWNKPDGFTIIDAPDIPEFLSDLQVGKVWGIGPATSLYLLKHNVRTALEFAEKPESWVRANMGSHHLETWHELRGTPVFNVREGAEDDQKSIQSTRTFSPPSANEELLLSELSRNVEHACAKARSHGLVAKRIHYFLKTQEFRYHRMEIPLTAALQSPNQIFDEIMKTFDAVYEPGVIYRATGVTLAGLMPEGLSQNDLFGEVVEKKKWNEVFHVVDTIDRRYGTNTVVLASSLSANKRRGVKPHKHLIIPFMGETE
jgi:nucleotidyltransferase/DNA polymerase involved in DNA repair